MMASADEIAVKGWQPIETAPRDEVEILVYAPDLDAPYWWSLSNHDNGRKYPAHSGRLVARWYDGQWVSIAGEQNWEDSSPIGLDPTHWMPLPEPPK